MVRLEHSWAFWGRPSQHAPEDDSWLTWLILAGRGWGKTRTGAEWIHQQAESGTCRRMHLVARTAADVRDTVVGGESGIVATSKPWFRPKWEPSKRLLTWPNGAVALTFSADEPDQLRGPQCDGAWCDEIAAWKYPDAWDQLQLGLRLGVRPRCVVTTTPRPTKVIRDLLSRATTTITRGSTFDNESNLATPFLETMLKIYEGTTLGKQELYAELLDETAGALWKLSQIEAYRVATCPERFRWIRIAIDPAVSVGEESDETGIVVVGGGLDGHAYVLEDASGRHAPEEWTATVVALHRKWHARSSSTPTVVAEINQGGNLVTHAIRSADGGKSLAVTTVRAKDGKRARATPVALLAEKGKVHHVGIFPKLEDQITTWEPSGDSPDRLDALVYAVTHDLASYQFAEQVSATPTRGSEEWEREQEQREVDAFEAREARGRLMQRLRPMPFGPRSIR